MRNISHAELQNWNSKVRFFLPESACRAVEGLAVDMGVSINLGPFVGVLS